MAQPVTTNPFIIMLINMTVVFLVLVSLGLVIRLIHVFDPTVKKEKAPEAAPAPVQEAAPVPELPNSYDGVDPEVVAVIAAAIASMSGGNLKVRAVHPVEREGWKQSGRLGR